MSDLLLESSDLLVLKLLGGKLLEIQIFFTVLDTVLNKFW